jgi:hypothetical protein
MEEALKAQSDIQGTNCRIKRIRLKMVIYLVRLIVKWTRLIVYILHYFRGTDLTNKNTKTNPTKQTQPNSQQYLFYCNCN